MATRQHFFYNITRKVITQFCDVFSNLKIARYDEMGTITKYVMVPMKFAPKTKQWYWDELKRNNDRRDHILPIISINLDSVDYANYRQLNKHIKIASNTTGSNTTRYYNPVPYDFTFKVKIYAEYMVDITQLIEQILPPFQPEAYIRITIPELKIDETGVNEEDGAGKLDLRVVYDGSDKNSPVELDEEAFRVLTWELTFKVQGYMFTPLYTDSLVHKVVQNYYVDEGGWNNRYLDVSKLIGDVGHASVQGISYATDVPQGTGLLTDAKRSKWAYEHYPKPPIRPIRLYTTPYSTDYRCSLDVTIGSDKPVKEIWYALIQNNTSINFNFIITNPYPTYVIVDDKQNSYTTTRYTVPIKLYNGDYKLVYFGISPEDSSTEVFVNNFNELPIETMMVDIQLPSGYYPIGTPITIISSPNSTVYYTTDGTEPDINSSIFDINTVILGYSRFRAIAIDNTCQFNKSNIDIRYYYPI